MKKIIKKIIQIYLKFLSKIVLFRYNPDIIAVAGSTGKQPIKEEIKKIFKKNFIVRMAPQKYNAQLGIPLSIFGLIANSSKIKIWFKIIIKATQITFFSKNFPQKIILEVGISQPNDIDYFLSLIKPEITILTNINTQYLDNFDNLDKIALEYKKLVQNTKKNGLVLLNCDDLRIKNLYSFSDAKTLCYGQKEGSDFKITKIKKENTKQIVTIKTANNLEKIHFMKKFGIHHARAIAVKEAINKFYDA